MSFILNVGAVLGMSLLLSLRFRDSLVRTLPITLCSTVLLLYVLAFFRKMAWIDLISAACLLGLTALFVLHGRRQGFHAVARAALEPFKNTQFWINIALLTAIVLLANHRQILEWDAYSFWGADIKSLYYRGGFAEKNSNVAAAFGNYPPMMQLAVWWFLHLFGRYHEGLLFGGYYFFGALLLLSLTDRLHFSKTWQKLAGGSVCAVALFMLPSVADTSWYRTLCADPIMGILFGCLLVELFSQQTCSRGFALYKFSVLTACVCLSKSIGFLWAAFAVIFLLVWRGWSAGNLKKAAVMLGAGGVTCASWSVFCQVLSRASYLSDKLGSTLGERLEELFSGVFLSAGNNAAYINSFGQAFLFSPAHREKTRALDLSPSLVILVILILFFVFWRCGWLSKGQLVRLEGFFLGACAVIYFVLLCGHLSIFYSETQYTEPLNMVTTMTRYGCPVMTGFLMLVFAIGAERLSLPGAPGKPRSLRAAAAWLPVLLILSAAGYNDISKCLIPGADPLDPQRVEKRTQFQTDMKPFLDAVAETVPLEGQGQRVLLLIDYAHDSPIISYCASPISIRSLPCSEISPFTAEGFLFTLENSGAEWFYIQDAPEEALNVLRSLAPQLQPHRLYSKDVLS